MTAGLHRNASRAPICFQGSAGTLVRFVIQGSPIGFRRRRGGFKFGHHDRTRTYILDLRRVVLIRLSYVVMDAGGATRRRRRYFSSSTSQYR